MIPGFRHVHFGDIDMLRKTFEACAAAIATFNVLIEENLLDRCVEMVEEGTFREDLYYRLNVIPVVIPPLRDRPEDIPLISLHFLQTFNEKYARSTQLSQDALDLQNISQPVHDQSQVSGNPRKDKSR